MRLRKKKTLLDQAKDQAEEVVEAMRPRVESALADAKEFVNDTALPALQDAKQKAAPVVAAGAAEVAEKAHHAKEYADAKVAEMTPEPKKKRSKVKVLLLFGAIAGALAMIAKRLQAGADESWQSYEPTPPPSEPEATESTDEADPLTDPLPEDADSESKPEN